MKKIHNIYLFVLYSIIAVFLLLALINLLPRLFGIRPFVVLSGSMEPEIPTGGVIFVDTNIPPDQIHVGDIITYALDDTTVTHRVIAETVTSVTAKGDANEQADFSPVSRDQILGRVLFDIPHLGYLYTRISQPLFITVLSSLLAVNLIIEAICSLKNTIKTKKKKEKLT